ncbi:MAG: cytochrome c-type biogenesis protein CcmH [Candidatus Binatia bacterium]|nr:cytochrome c-type biogenesis protein CcmH [Candidatus Binatia bacterium]
MQSRILLLAVLLCVSVAAAAPVLTTQEMEEALTCQCGCGLTVHSCNHLQCGFAIPAKQEIARAVSEGKTREEILASFVARYGEKVLSAPTVSGFNLVAWITPFLAIVGGAVFISIVGLRWARRQPQAAAPPPVSSETARYRHRLQQDLESFDV